MYLIGDTGYGSSKVPAAGVPHQSMVMRNSSLRQSFKNGESLIYIFYIIIGIIVDIGYKDCGYKSQGRS